VWGVGGGGGGGVVGVTCGWLQVLRVHHVLCASVDMHRTCQVSATPPARQRRAPRYLPQTGSPCSTAFSTSSERFSLLTSATRCSCYRFSAAEHHTLSSHSNSPPPSADSWSCSSPSTPWASLPAPLPSCANPVPFHHNPKPLYFPPSNHFTFQQFLHEGCCCWNCRCATHVPAAPSAGNLA
jgi:hypothetical protein